MALPTYDAPEYVEIAELLQKSSRILVVSHLVPDADAFGSSMALAAVLRQIGKEAEAAVPGGDDGKHDCVPGIESTASEVPDLAGFDLLVYCDCADKSRVGDAFEANLAPFTGAVANIDHHHTNTEFGDCNLIDGKASSTCELIARLLPLLQAPLTPEIATALLTGIVGDTGGFRYTSTTPETLSLSAELFRAGGDLPGVNETLYSNNSLTTIRLQSLAMQNLILDLEGRIAGVYLDQGRYDAAQAGPMDVESLVEEIRDIENVEIAYTIRWVDGLWKASLRSKGTHFDVSQVAAAFGGGGHRAAAAFRHKGALEELLGRLREQLRSLLEV